MPKTVEHALYNMLKSEVKISRNCYSYWFCSAKTQQPAVQTQLPRTVSYDQLQQQLLRVEMNQAYTLVSELNSFLTWLIS